MNKSTNPTQDEFLDQTFMENEEQDFDAHTEEFTNEGEDTPTKKATKKGGVMKYVYIGGGLVMAGMAGMVLMGGEEEYVPQATPNPVQQNNQGQQPSEQFNNMGEGNYLGENNYVSGNPMAGERVNENIQGNQNIFDPNANMNHPINELQNNNPFGETRVPQDAGMNFNSFNDIDEGVQGGVFEETSVQVNIPTGNNFNNSPSVSNNNVQQELIGQLKVLLAEQTEEISKNITRVDEKVIAVSDKLDEHLKDSDDKYKLLDERIAKLEAGLKTEEVKTAEVAKVVETKKAAAPKKAAPKRTAAAKPKAKAPAKPKTSVLVDNSRNSNQRAAATRSTPSVSMKPHSIFSGRVWLRNSDGSLSTFVAGDRLPNGETIVEVRTDRFITSSGGEHR